jgi:phage tail sheath gpL-like
VSGVLSEPFVIDPADSMAVVCDNLVEKVNAVLKMPVLATDGTTYAEYTAKWAGETGNGLDIEVIGESLGITFTIIQPTGGLVNPSVESALAQMGNVWDSMVINQMNIDDDDTLDAFQEFGEGRWGELVRKPLLVFTGTVEDDVSTAVGPVSTRRDDRVNVQIPAPGSVNLPFVVAARGVARIAKVANNDPAFDYGSQRLTGLIPGNDGQQWDATEREFAVTSGSSTTQVADGVIVLSDTVTCYRPEGDPIPAYRFAVDVVKLMTILFNLDLAFATPEWDGAPLVPDNQVVSNPNARQPKHAKAVIAGIIDSLGRAAIISDPETAKGTIDCDIDTQNPKRLNMTCTVQLSGNTNVKDVQLKFGFFFGTAAAA